MLTFWNLPQRLRPKIWPKEGQNFSKLKKFKILNKDKKDYKKITTFCKNKKKHFISLFFCFLGLEDPQKPQFFSLLAKSGYFVINFLILI